MDFTLRDVETKRLTPFGRSLIGALVVVAAAACYVVFVGFWVADPETRDKFRSIDPLTVDLVETDLGAEQFVTTAGPNRDKVAALVDAMRQARTKQGYKPAPDAAPGYIRVRTKTGDKVENVTVIFPAEYLRDRFGPEVDAAARAVHAAGRPKGE